MSDEIIIKLNKKLSLRDPEETALGKKIISHSIILIDKLGFEQFTFKKLAVAIKSTEASVYRYFENKHLLLTYLLNWYWAWLDYRIDLKTGEITNPAERLKVILKIITESSIEDESIPHIDESVLHRIVVRESSKTYLNIQVDDDNRDGFFTNYKLLCAKIASCILEINPGYNYPHALSSTLIETAHQQLFFAQHLPKLTDLSLKANDGKPIEDLLQHIAFSCIHKA